TLATATSLGALSTTAATASDWVGNAAPNDYYQFTLSALSNVTLKLSGLANANGTLSLLDSSGNQYGYSYASGSDGFLVANLAAGTYYVNVHDSYDTTYTLSASAAALPNAAGSSLATALNVGALGATAIVESDWIGNAASTDYYTFSLSASKVVNLTFASSNGSSGSIFLLDSSGGMIGSSTYNGLGGLTSVVATLAKGTYFAEVADGIDTNYSLTFSTGAPAVGTSATDGADNSLAAAKAIGALSATAKTYADWVGATDAKDVYQFTLSSLSTVTLQLAGLASGASDTLALYDANGAQVAYTYAGSSYNGLISDNLSAGTYYAVITGGGSDSGYNFSASAAALPSAIGTTLAMSTSLGALGTTAVTKSDWIGAAAPDDYYSFTLGALATVSFTFSGGDFATLTLLDNAGNRLASANSYYYNGHGDSPIAGLSATLAAGTYYLHLSDSLDTAYKLTAVSSVAAGIAPALTAGRSLAAATSLGALSATAVAKTDWVGDAAPDEWFKFTVGAP
ncbi:hypothetical protein M2323_004704, partial [Rhodoblastus acidophilus]